MKKFNTFIIAFFCLLLTQLNAQQGRYTTEVFSSVKVTSNVVYGVNATVLAFAQAGQAIPQPLAMDVYEPEGDTETARPLIIICHTGNFLPHPQNGGTQGTKGDSAIVYIAKKMAKRGYVVASMTYRLGWNPVAPTQDARVLTLINAAYRGIQDARTCIRFFKKSAAVGGNTFGIDPGKIILWGDGTGGYISLATATLDSYAEVLLPKFTLDIPMVGPVPMVLENVNGNIYGTNVGIVNALSSAITGFPVGDTLNYPNHAEYDSDFQLAVNMGGALADTSFVDPGGPAIISFHVPSDPFAPYKEGIVLVPVVNLPVVEVQGSYLVQQEANADGLNSAFAGLGFAGDFSAVANSRNDGLSGLFPLIGSGGPLDSSPWQWWSPSNPNNNAGLATNPNMSAAKGMSYCDTMIAYVSPRACLQLNLGCDITEVKELQPSQIGLAMSPNPASSEVSIKTAAGYPIESIYMYDMNGRLVKAHVKVNANQFTMERNNLQTGMYVVKVMVKEGAAAQKIMFR